MTVPLTKIRATPAQAIVSSARYPASAAIISRNMALLGMRIPHVLDQLGLVQQFLDIAGDSANGNLVPLWPVHVPEQLADSDPRKKTFLEFRQLYAGRYKMPMPPVATYAWDGIAIAATALAAGPDRIKVRMRIELLTGFRGHWGYYRFSAGNHYGRYTNDVVMGMVAHRALTILQH